jgi:hypothetical protein
MLKMRPALLLCRRNKLVPPGVHECPVLLVRAKKEHRMSSFRSHSACHNSVRQCSGSWIPSNSQIANVLERARTEDRPVERVSGSRPSAEYTRKEYSLNP